MRPLIPQETYDALCRRLTQHHKAHKGLSDFPAVRSGLERTARITSNGVEVDIRRLTIAADAIRDNIKFVGEKYGTAPDKTILLDIEDALAEYEATSVSPVPEVASTAPHDQKTTELVEPSQRNEPTKPSNETEVQGGHRQPLAAKPYLGTDSRVAKRINGGLDHSPVPYGPLINIPNADRQNLPEPPQGYVWWSDGSGGFDAMPAMAELPDID